MSREYETFLRGTLAGERVTAEVQGEREMRARVRDYQEKLRAVNDEETLKKEEQKEKDLAAIRKKTEEALKKIETLKTTNKANYDKKEDEIRKNAQEEMDKTEQEYKEIIEKHKTELEKERLDIETNLLRIDSKLIETRQEFSNTKIRMMEETEEKLEKKREFHHKQDTVRNKEELGKLVENMESQKSNLQAVAKKSDEYGDKKLALHRDLEGKNLELQKTAFHTLALQNDRTNARKLNQFAGQLQESWENVSESFEACQTHFSDGFDAKKMEKAGKCFKNFTGGIHKLNGKMLDLQQKLTDVENDEEKKDKVEKMKQITLMNFKISGCAAKFSARYMAGNNARCIDEEDKLSQLVGELAVLMASFGVFDSRNSELTAHLTNSLPQASTSDSTA